MQKSTTSKASGKAKKKPKQDKPPCLHPTGRWCKKVNGRLVYLGSVKDDPTGERAQRIWNEQAHGIRAGRKPIIDADAQPEGVTVKVLCDTFLESKERLVTTGEMAQRSFDDLHRTCLKVADTLIRHRLVSDLKPGDFAYLRDVLAKGRGLVSLKGDISRARNLFNWGYKAELLERPVRFGESFKPPSVDRLRMARADKPVKLFEQPDLRRIIDKAKHPVRAMILLGINCGLGNADCARLKFKHVDLDNFWLTFPRPKTGEPRRGKLWPETITAIEEAIADRPTPKDESEADYVFITKYGRSWQERPKCRNPLSHEFAKILDALDLRQTGVNFYSLRHTLQTIGEGARDVAALRRIMGHVAPANDMSAHYRERIEDTRLVAVADYMHAWLYPADGESVKPR